MFTGIVERTGKVVGLEKAKVTVGTSSMSAITRLMIDPGEGLETNLGDSVAVNGCCLTVAEKNLSHHLAFDVTGETLDKTSLGLLKTGSTVNLERALRVGDRLGGHIVSGHVDGKGLVRSLAKQDDGWHLVVALTPLLGRYCIPKGSICLDGISLTVNTVEDFPDEVLIHIRLIPTTIQMTTFNDLKNGQPLNVEVDNIGKYIERLVKPFI